MICMGNGGTQERVNYGKNGERIKKRDGARGEEMRGNVITGDEETRKRYGRRNLEGRE